MKILPYDTMEKGYYEAGLLINNIVRVQLFRYGVGCNIPVRSLFLSQNY